MNYLYDILLNFNLRLYETYEWERNDQITHIRKIPFFKINVEIDHVGIQNRLFVI